MSNNTNQQIPQEKRRPEISASVGLWQKFDEWWRKQGCTTLPEGLRTAMRIVINFNNENQGKSESSLTSS